MSACLDCKDMLRYSGAHDCEIRIRDACCSLRVSCSCSRMHSLAGLLIRRTLWSIANVLEGSHPNGRSCVRNTDASSLHALWVTPRARRVERCSRITAAVIPRLTVWLLYERRA